MIYGYGRVSTAKQLAGNSVEDQTAKLKSAGATETFIDVFTGTTKERPELKQLMSRLMAGDTVIVCKLDRLARSVHDGIEIIDDILAAGASIEILGLGKLDSTPIGVLTRNILLSFAEFERSQILERMSAGRDRARARGCRVDGRPPKYGKKQIRHALELIDGGLSYSEVTKMTGISKSTLVRAKRAREAGNEYDS